MKKTDEGFTLIELLIVIVILGILATVVVFSVRGITDDGQDNACQTDERTLSVAVEAYFAKYGSAGGVDEQSIVDAGLMRDLSANYDISGTTGDTLVGTGECA
ncbi:MAG: type II secretion system protein [Ilumatobacter sp.]|uniref:type IV pilin protein n=1 Tax=Ilumatobacter sp. TaxID=1967498 RepID=UPI0026057736|nr:type II secretion system protein [Ilumatobacter sp.]MDJ0768639.1 type II secretion system protein [Ilumatobacter sp.]